MKYIQKTLILVGLTVLLSACNKADPIDPLAGGGGLSGDWVSSDNVFTASFNNGTFLALANDTGGKISEGNYVVTSAAQIRLDWRGVVSGTNNAAICNRPDASTLICTDTGSKTFTLIKKSPIT
ncbi:MAG: hypothetical protein COC00_003760 [Rhizobiales bacterium]|nr:hypothetical protein [Hyphomicrobiales bacterium]